MGVWFACGVQRCLEFDVEGARSNATPAQWAANLHIVDRIKPNRRIKKCGRPVTRYRALAVAKSENFSDLVV